MKLDPSFLRDEPDHGAGELPPDHPARGPFIPTEFNQRIFDFIAYESGSLIVEAVAGSGKTSQILQSLVRLTPHDDVQVLAFNVGIVAEFRERKTELDILAHVSIDTFHAAAFRSVIDHLGARTDLRTGKVRDLAKGLFTSQDYHKYGGFCVKAVSLAKAEGIGTSLNDDPEAWRTLVTHYDLAIDPMKGDTDKEISQAIGMSYDLLNLSNKKAETGLIDFDDQLYLIALWDLPCRQFGWVFIDEAQDTNVVRRDFAKRTLREGGRIMCVGDEKQSVYGFTGATPDAMDKLRIAFNATTLPLSVNYRCDESIVEVAQEYDPRILPRPHAPRGEVLRDCSQRTAIAKLTKFDAILCRNNAPLVELCYDLIAQGVPATVLGRDIGKGLIDLLINLRAATLESLEIRLEQYRKREMERHRLKGDLNKAAQVDDKVACLKIIMAGLSGDDRTLYGLEQAITSIFSENEKHVLTLSTIHKAKGKEWDQVALLRWDLIPASWASQSWQEEQEKNLQLVAVTRAKHRLMFLDTPAK